MARSTYWRREYPSPLHLLQNELGRILGDYIEGRPAAADRAHAGDELAQRTQRSTFTRRPRK